MSLWIKNALNLCNIVNVMTGSTISNCLDLASPLSHIDQVKNSVVAELGNTHGQESKTRRVIFQYDSF